MLLDSLQPSAGFHGKCALTVMAKAPVAGKVKTRLTPSITPEQAAVLNACFLKDTIGSLADATAADRGALGHFLHANRRRSVF